MILFHDLKLQLVFSVSSFSKFDSAASKLIELRRRLIVSNSRRVESSDSAASCRLPRPSASETLEVCNLHFICCCARYSIAAFDWTVQHYRQLFDRPNHDEVCDSDNLVAEADILRGRYVLHLWASAALTFCATR